MQINRLFEIIYILLDKKRVTAKELAEHFEVSPRTIYRDIETLSIAGIPIYMSKGKGGGVSLLSEFVLNKAVITEKEKEEIMSSLKAVSAVKPGEEDTVLRKLSSLFGESDNDWIEVDFGSWSDGRKESFLFRTLKEAILNKRIVRFSYMGGNGRAMNRDVEPLRLCFKGGAWYLYGYCRKRGDYRFFKLKRIRDLLIEEETFSRTCPEPVLVNRQSDFGTETVHLKLKIKKEAAYRVYDEFEIYEQLEDGNFLVEIDFPRGEWLTYYILSFGKSLEVLGPEEVRKQIVEELNKTIEIYF